MSGLGITEEDERVGLKALAFELKNTLVTIARSAELGDVRASRQIQQSAEQSLRLIDSYLLTARSEYGQVPLELEPTIVGSILYDVSQELRVQAESYNVSLVVEDRTDGPVMTHREALIAILHAFGAAIIRQGDPQRHNEVILRGYKTRNGKLGIGMFSDNPIHQEDLRRALELQGRAHMPLSVAGGQGHVSLLIAKHLCRAVGGTLSVKKMGALSGFATELPRSEQLSFV